MQCNRDSRLLRIKNYFPLRCVRVEAIVQNSLLYTPQRIFYFMEELINFGSEKKYSSVYLTEQVNFFRKQENNTRVLFHKNLLGKIEREFEEEINGQFILPVTYKDAKGEQRKSFDLTYEQSLQVLMSESKIVRKGVIEVLKAQQREIQIPKVPKTYGAALLEAGRLALELENTQIKLLEANKTVSILTHVSKQYTATEIAKELGLHSAIELNKLLFEKQIQFNQSGTWVLYSKYSNLGYVDIKQEILDNGRVIYHRRWTQTGREFLVKLFTKQ